MFSCDPTNLRIVCLKNLLLFLFLDMGRFEVGVCFQSINVRPALIATVWPARLVYASFHVPTTSFVERAALYFVGCVLML